MSARSENSNVAAFRRGRWILAGQGLVFLLAGGWALVTAWLGGSHAVVFGTPVPTGLAGIVATAGLASVVCASNRRAGSVFVCVQAPLFLILFMVSAATRHSGVWQSVFGYDSAMSLAYLVIGLLGLFLVMWMFPHAISERDRPRLRIRRNHHGRP
ncbi:hypothetical protein [Kutzneria sp. 744]|uniref:hypothetical protein n=1 Tax=Kutzneria sp. (strain 744) TaxID=345341 RepID=UPI0003EEB2B0|nr:hypothetical protein [Kutzneria sp. 744]EWM18708.1 hypothetical protein KUTG_09012 [Kutzneria sp. 744]